MMILMVELIILVICISDRASDMNKTGTGRSSSGEMKECENFYASLSIHGLDEQKSRIHASSSRHSSVCINDKRIGMTAEEQEHRFRGSIILTANDCTVKNYSSYTHANEMIHGFLC